MEQDSSFGIAPISNEDTSFLISVWLVFSVLALLWGDELYWNYTHPIGKSGPFGFLGYLIGMFVSLLIVILLMIIIILKKKYTLMYRGFIKPLLKLSIIFVIVFQGYLLVSAYNAYHAAKQMQAKDINSKNIFDFYSPFIRYIYIRAGEPAKGYRWSYHRSKYVAK